MKARANAQLNLPPTEVQKSEVRPAAFRKSEDHATAFQKSEDDGYRTASELFDASMSALEASGRLTNKEVAHLCGVSVSLVEKWRQRDSRSCPSFAQMLRLPASFHIELHRAMNRRYGFGKAALASLLEAAGALAVFCE